MNLINLNPKKQREALLTISKRLADAAADWDQESVELLLGALQEGVLEELQNEYGDFFGTEGWEHWLGLD